MDKYFMLEQIRIRKKELKEKLASNAYGSYGSAAVMRSRTNRDLGTLLVIETLLDACRADVEIDSPEFEAAFDRLVEPRRK